MLRISNLRAFILVASFSLMFVSQAQADDDSDDDGAGGVEAQDEGNSAGDDGDDGDDGSSEDDEGNPGPGDDRSADDSDDNEDDTGLPTWRPRGGSMFGSGPTFNQSSGQGSDDELSGHPVRAPQEESSDDRPELLVFDLYLGDGVSFEQRYLTRLENALAGALESNESLRPLNPRERSRRLTQASQLVGDEVSDDYAESVAVAIEAEYYLIPRIVVENSRNYRVSATFGRAGTGESGRRVETQTSNRVVDNVERLVRDLARAALATAGE